MPRGAKSQELLLKQYFDPGGVAFLKWFDKDVWNCHPETWGNDFPICWAYFWNRWLDLPTSFCIFGIFVWGESHRTHHDSGWEMGPVLMKKIIEDDRHDRLSNGKQTPTEQFTHKIIQFNDSPGFWKVPLFPFFEISQRNQHFFDGRGLPSAK